MTLHSPAIKLFVGYRMSPELKAHLAHIPSLEEMTGLSHNYFEGKEYVGLYLSTPKPTLDEVKQTKEHVKEALATNCPDLRLEGLALVVFPQVFLA